MITYKLIPIDQLPVVHAKQMDNSSVQHAASSSGEKESISSPELSEPNDSTEQHAASMLSASDSEPKESELLQSPPPPPPPDNREILKSTDIDSILSSLPQQLQEKSKVILAYLIRAGVQIELGSKRIIYENEVVGSPLPNLLHWTTESKRTLDRPWDQMRFFRLLADLSIPKSLFGTGKYRLAQVAAKPYPIAVKRSKAAISSNELPEKRWKALF